MKIFLCVIFFIVCMVFMSGVFGCGDNPVAPTVDTVLAEEDFQVRKPYPRPKPKPPPD